MTEFTMEWLEDDVMLLIEEYKHHRCLWDSEDPGFKHISRKNDAWQEIAEAMKIPSHEAKKKMSSLLSSFRRERRKEVATSGMGSGKPYRSRWFAFKSMTFLLDKINWGKGRCEGNTVEESEGYATSLDGFEDEGTSNGIVSQTEYSASDEIHGEDIEEPPRKKSKCKKGDEYDDAAADLNMIINIIDAIRNKRQATKNKKSDSKSPHEMFADYVALKLDTYSSHVRNIVQFKIHEVLFQADMGSFNNLSATNDETEIIQPSQSSPNITIDTNNIKLDSDSMLDSL